MLPGQLIIPRKEIADSTAFSERLAQAMGAQVFKGFPIPPSLKNTDLLCLARNDRLQGSLTFKYNGSFKVLAIFYNIAIWLS